MLFKDDITILASFASWSAGHVKREVNGVAHLLVKNDILLDEDKAELECIPIGIKNVASLDDVILK